MLEIWLIRHGMTEGNKYGRYIGVTDESLCEEGKAFLEKLSYPDVQAVYVSPMTRCRETAQLLYPQKNLQIVDELAECDFGDFENKNYKELANNPDYQLWIDSGGALAFPNGESKEIFQKRSLKGFQKAVAGCIRKGVTKAALVVHGGTIMSIMEEYSNIHRSYYEWHVKNGGGYQIRIDEERWMQDKREVILCSSIMESR